MSDVKSTPKIPTGMAMMLKSLAGSLGIDFAAIENQVAQFGQIMAGIFAGISAVQKQNTEILTNQKLIMEKLGIAENDKGPIFDLTAGHRTSAEQ